ncbi:hypothetical protein [Aquabacterium sp.]|uniref:hypothetical protein n=1 Tax=Aquabacterium sp. TaxID=1872578 RepID=UPI0035AE7FB5
MNVAYSRLRQELLEIIGGFNQFLPNDQALNIATGVISAPGINRQDLIYEADALVKLIDKKAPLLPDGDFGFEQQLLDFLPRLEFLRAHTLGQIWGGNAPLAVQAVLTTLNTLKRLLDRSFEKIDVAEADIVAAAERFGDISRRLGELDLGISEIEIRVKSVRGLFDEIHAVHGVAGGIDKDLKYIEKSRNEMAAALEDVKKDSGAVYSILHDCADKRAQMERMEASAADVLSKCEAGYVALISQGLGAAFSKRSRSLQWSMLAWVFGLVAALLVGAIFGSHQLEELKKALISPTASALALGVSLFLSFISVGAPVWFAWLSTKQIGQRFRLAEDYAYKATISAAYEGYRRQAATVSGDLVGKLLQSALDRFDEQPLRFVQDDAHGSPWHELFSSDVVRSAFKQVPDFAGEVRKLAQELVKSRGKIKNGGMGGETD